MISLPVIIQNWIEALQDPTTPSHIKDNYCRMLEGVATACAHEVEKFRSHKFKQPVRSKRRV